MPTNLNNYDDYDFIGNEDRWQKANGDVKLQLREPWKKNQEPANEESPQEVPDAQLIEETWAGPFGMGGNCPGEARAFLVIPNGGNTHVEHQYGCVSCMHFVHDDCQLFALYGGAGDDMHEALTPCSPDPDQINRALHKWFGDDRTLHSYSEGFADCGDFVILVANCD